MTDPLLTIIIVTWNGGAKLLNCLTSIYAGRLPPALIVVIDNASSDDSMQRLQTMFPKVEAHQNQTNIGHTKAVNQGFALSRGEYILVLDQDTELQPDCIELMLGFLEARPDVAMVAPRTFNTDGTVQESARNFPEVMSGLFGRQSLLTRLWPGNPVTRRYLGREFLQATTPFRVEQIGGACMLFRRRVLDLVGPLDERYLGYWVDTDWCRSLHRKGLPIYCVPEARLTHHEGNAKHRRKTARRIWMFHRGAHQYYTKWHCRGPWDPRSIFAGLMLALRASLQTIVNKVAQIDVPANHQGSSRGPVV